MSARNNLFFYDWELYGTDPVSNPPCQVAFIQTDSEFNILDQGETLIAPRADAVIETGSIPVHGINPFYALSNGVTEHQAYRQLHKKMAQGKQTQIGYNNMSFDKECNRFGFHRNLLDPYGPEWQFGNKKNDAYFLMQFAYMLSPKAINWPSEIIEGEKVLKLKQDMLTVANNIQHVGAHTALADTKALMDLVKMVARKKPNLYNFWLRSSDKHNVSRTLSSSGMTWFVSQYNERAKNFLQPILFLGLDKDNSNKAICINLNADIEKILSFSTEAINQAYDKPKLERGEDEHQLLKAIRHIKINESPIVLTNEQMSMKAVERAGYDYERILENYHKLCGGNAKIELYKKIISANAHHDYKQLLDSDYNLYDGFPSNAEKSFSQQLADCDVKHWGSLFDNAPTASIALRMTSVMAREGEPLSRDQRIDWLLQCSRRLIGRDNKPARNIIDVKSEAAEHLITKGVDLSKIDTDSVIKELSSEKSITGDVDKANLASYIYSKNQLVALSKAIELELNAGPKNKQTLELESARNTIRQTTAAMI